MATIMFKFKLMFFFLTGQVPNVLGVTPPANVKIIGAGHDEKNRKSHAPNMKQPPPMVSVGYFMGKGLHSWMYPWILSLVE